MGDTTPESMMREVPRVTPTPSGDMVTDEYGDYVEYHDFAVFAADVAAFIRAAESAAVERTREDRDRLAAECERLRAEKALIVQGAQDRDEQHGRTESVYEADRFGLACALGLGDEHLDEKVMFDDLVAKVRALRARAGGDDGSE